MRAPILALAATSLLVFSACGDDNTVEEGKVTVSVYGEEFIEQGIPAEEMDDGWAVTFDSFKVSIQDVVIGGVKMPPSAPVNIAIETAGNGQPLVAGNVAVGSHTGSGFVISRVEVAGSATKDGQVKTFDWAFDKATTYSDCQTTTKVVDDNIATFEITVHADHLFYDSLVSEDPKVLFQALADADKDADGVITRAELEMTDIGGYDPGSAGGVDNLWAWLVAQTHSLGHVDGEGHCEASVK